MAEPIINQVQDAGHTALANSGSNSASPFIMNPGNGQFVPNPGFLNALQAFDLMLAQNPQFAAELKNEEQRSLIASPQDLTNFHNPASGMTPAYGSTYGDLAGASGQGGVVQQSPQQNEEVTQLQNALSALNNAYLASKNVSGGSLSVGLGGILSKIGLGSAANMLPGYSQYQQAVSALGQNPYAQGASSLFSATPGVAPQQDEYQSYVQNLQNSLSRLNQPAPAAPLPPGATQPMSMPSSEPYSASQIPVLNPAQLGANARSINGR